MPESKMSSQQPSKMPANFIDPGGMGALVLAGGMGAALNYALYPHIEERFSLPVDQVLQDLGYMVKSLDTLKTFLIVAFGFIGGMLLLFLCMFLKTMVVRFLLDYNGWFLSPKNPLNKVLFQTAHYCYSTMISRTHITAFLLEIATIFSFVAHKFNYKCMLMFPMVYSVVVRVDACPGWEQEQRFWMVPGLSPLSTSSTSESHSQEVSLPSL